MKKHLIAGMLLFCSTIISSTSVYGNEVEVVDVKVTVAGGNQYRFEVTLKHEDENWEHLPIVGRSLMQMVISWQPEYYIILMSMSSHLLVH